SREKGLVLEAGNTGTLRGARERVRAFTQRAEEVTNLIDELKGIDTVNAGSLDALEGFRIALPFLRKVKTIAESRTLSAMGIDESHLSEEQQQPIVELCIELNEKAEAVNNAEAEARGQEILLQIAVDNIKQVYNVDDEQAKALLSEEGLKKWFDKEKDETSPGLRGIHQRLTRRLRKGVSNQEQGLLKRVSPGEMLGIGIDNNGNVVLSETGTQYAEALGRLDNAIGENGELNTDADTLGKDIALLRSLGLRVGAGSTMDKIRNLVTRGELLTTEAMKKLEKLQDLVENGVVGVIEIAAVAATVVVAKEIVEGVGGLLEAGMDNMSDSIRLTLDHLRESVTGVEGAVDVARDTLAQNDLRDPQFIGGANDVARNAQHAYDVGILSSAQSTLSSLQNIISSNVSMLSRTNALGNFGQRLSESGIVNTAAGLTLGAVVAETNARTLQLGTKISNGISGLRASMARARGERNYLTVEEAWQEIADSSRTEASEDNAIFDKNKAEAETLKALIDEAAKSGTAIEELLKTRIDTLTNK
ncbi:MAG: hypothetical protein OEX81_04475, partial [Candidatus Pacebacteria bacterium]|nr:hypothetical protein [Candidatus Paceibacterota bacterium]